MKRFLTLSCALGIFYVIAVSLLLAQDNADQFEQEPGQEPEQEQRRQRHLQRFLSQFRIDESLSPEQRLAYAIEKFVHTSIFDKKTVHFNVKGRKEGSSIVLEGEVIFPQHRNGLESVLKRLGFDEIDNRITLLPEEGGLGTLDYALVTSYTARLEQDYTVPRSILDEAVYGQYVRLLKQGEDGEHLFVQVPNGYIGWIKAAAVRRISHAEWRAMMNSWPKALVLEAISVKVDKGLVEIPRGALLPVIKQGTNDARIRLPDEKSTTVSLKDVQIVNPDVQSGKARILEIANPLLGLRYTWGGFSSRGYDCSGFSRIIYMQRNVYLPRDADQQSAVGEIVAFRGDPSETLPGDLHFYMNQFGRISHVSVSLGGADYIHCSSPDVHINSFNPDSPVYNARYHDIFAYARRILVGGF